MGRQQWDCTTGDDRCTHPSGLDQIRFFFFFFFFLFCVQVDSSPLAPTDPSPNSAKRQAEPHLLLLLLLLLLRCCCFSLLTRNQQDSGGGGGGGGRAVRLITTETNNGREKERGEIEEKIRLGRKRPLSPSLRLSVSAQAVCCLSVVSLLRACVCVCSIYFIPASGTGRQTTLAVSGRSLVGRSFVCPFCVIGS